MSVLPSFLAAVAVAAFGHARLQQPRGCVGIPVDAMHKVMPGVSPTALARPVAAARGELVHLQVAFTGCSFNAGDRILASVAGLGLVTVRRVAYHNLTLAGDVRPANGIEAVSRPGFFPDALIPIGRAAVAAAGIDSARLPLVFWLTIDVPRAATAGVHAGSLSVPACSGCRTPAATFTVQVC
jgi:hypothetical protein